MAVMRRYIAVASEDVGLFGRRLTYTSRHWTRRGAERAARRAERRWNDGTIPQDVTRRLEFYAAKRASPFVRC